MVSMNQAGKYLLVGGMAAGLGTSVVYVAGEFIGGTKGQAMKDVASARPIATALAVAGATALIIPKATAALS